MRTRSGPGSIGHRWGVSLYIPPAGELAADAALASVCHLPQGTGDAATAPCRADARALIGGGKGGGARGSARALGAVRRATVRPAIGWPEGTLEGGPGRVVVATPWAGIRIREGGAEGGRAWAGWMKEEWKLERR